MTKKDYDVGINDFLTIALSKALQAHDMKVDTTDKRFTYCFKELRESYDKNPYIDTVLPEVFEKHFGKTLTDEQLMSFGMI